MLLLLNDKLCNFCNSHYLNSRRLNKSGYNCRYLDAPHQLPPLESGDKQNGQRNARAWFLYSAANPSDRSKSLIEKPIEYVGINDSLELVKEVLGGLDQPVCMFGFSQGAVFAHIILALASSRVHPFSIIKCGIAASGFAGQVSLLLGMPADKVNVVRTEQ